MRLILTVFLALTGGAAYAHPGHWGDLAGHDHWVAGAAIGLAGLAALWGALKGKKSKSEEDTENDASPSDETEEEPA